MVDSVMGGGMAKQPEDLYTLELALPMRRGRGRPPKPDALTPAQRAQRYRDRKASRKLVAMKQWQQVKYRDPLTGKTWTGRGLTPKWLAIKVQEGVDKSFFLVKSWK